MVYQFGIRERLVKSQEQKKNGKREQEIDPPWYIYISVDKYMLGMLYT